MLNDIEFDRGEQNICLDCIDDIGRGERKSGVSKKARYSTLAKKLIFRTMKKNEIVQLLVMGETRSICFVFFSTWVGYFCLLVLLQNHIIIS